MKPKLIIVIGMPGSGKTTYLERLLQNKTITEFYDDYQGHTYDGQLDPRLSKYYTPLLTRLKRGKTLAVSDIRYCLHEELNRFVQAILEVAPETLLEFCYFENDPQSCKKNVKKRARTDRVERELRLIDEYAPRYTIPAVQVLKVKS